MVVGNGLMAQAFMKYADDESLIIFASGVSNSLETRESEFQRESLLLSSYLNNFRSKRIVYFSTCSIYDKSLDESVYIAHKIRMENLIQSIHTNYLVIRLPNVVGYGGNKNTLINFFINAIENNKVIEVWGTSYRNILSQEDVTLIVQKILTKNYINKIINVANPNFYTVTEILQFIEEFLKKKSIKTIIDKGEEYSIDTSFSREITLSIRKDYSINYLRSILEKYY